MTTRAKLSLCAGLVALAVGVAFVWRRPLATVELSFVRYTNQGVVLCLTNRGEYALPVTCTYPDVAVVTVKGPFRGPGQLFLHAHCSTQLVAWPSPKPGIMTAIRIIGDPPPPPLPASISVRYWPVQSAPRLMRVLLGHVGIAASTGAV